MNFKCINKLRQWREQMALTLLELMVAISLLSIIILGLYMMFDRTQSAFRGSMTQVDLLESARIALQMISREVEQAEASHVTVGTNFYVADLTVPSPLTQTTLDGVPHTFRLQEFFFLNKQENWKGIAYLIAAPSTNTVDMVLYTNGVGTLVRWEGTVTNINLFNPNDLLTNYLSGANTTNYQRVADGVVNLSLRGYDTNHYLLFTNSINWLTNTTLPASVDLEFAVLEPAIFQQARSFSNPTVSRNFLQNTNRAARIHVFTKHIQIRTVTQ